MSKTLCIFGSRSLVGESVERIIHQEIELYKPEMIITSGNTYGVCEVGRDIAKTLCIPLKVHFINNTKYAQGKYEHRSKAILKETDFCIFIHDGKSKGTLNEMKLCDKLGVKYKYFKIDALEYNVTFSIENFKLDFM